jgi:hypothetical protein
MYYCMGYAWCVTHLKCKSKEGLTRLDYNFKSNSTRIDTLRTQPSTTARQATKLLGHHALLYHCMQVPVTEAQ